jgi:hypothetical protein
MRFALRAGYLDVEGRTVNILYQKQENRMHSQFLRGAVEVLSTLTAAGCQVHAEGDALHVRDPKKVMTAELRESIRQHKLAILALLQRDTLRRLLQVLDMAQPAIPVGLQEDFAAAWLMAVRMVGDLWVEEEDPIL